MSIALTYAIAFVPASVYILIFGSYTRVLAFKRTLVRQLLSAEGSEERYSVAHGKIDADSEVVERWNTIDLSMFDSALDRLSFLAAVGANSVFTFLAALMVLVMAGFPADLPQVFVQACERVPPSVASALAGAYLFGIYEILERYWSASLCAVSLHRVWLRLWLSGAVGALLHSAFGQLLGPIAAFGVGMLPIREVVEFLRNRAGQKLDPAAPAGAAPEVPPAFNVLQGATKKVSERLSEVEIRSAEQLAHADPLKLLLRTNLEWRAIVDLIDQALLYSYIGDRIAALRPIGIRGATELIEACDSLNSTAPSEAVGRIATTLGQDVAGTQLLVRSLGENPCVASLRGLAERTAAGAGTSSTGSRGAAA